MSENATERRIRVKINRESFEYIHNDLENASHYFKELIIGREEKDDRSGIAFEMMAAQVMMAFWMEAALNFFGEMKVAKWRERDNSAQKLNNVLGALGLTPDLNDRPYSVFERLRKVRNALAHGKPERLQDEKLIEVRVGYADRPETLESNWVSGLTVESIVENYEDADAVWHRLLEASGIEHFEALSRSGNSVSYEGEVEEEIAEEEDRV